MAQCPTDNDSLNATNAPGGFGDRVSMQAAPLEAAMRERLREAADRSERLTMEDELSTAAATSEAPPIDAPTRADEKASRILGKRAMQFVEAEGGARQRNIDLYEELRRVFDGASQQQATFWMNLQNEAYKFCVDDRGIMRLFADTELREAGKLPYELRFVQEFDQMIPKIRGQHDIFQTEINKIKDSLTPLARRTTLGEDKLMTYGGYYLTALHTPEDNAHLLSRWKETAAENDRIIASLAGRNLKSAEYSALQSLRQSTAVLKKNAVALEKDIDNPNPPEKLVSCGYTNGQARELMRAIEQESGLTKDELEGIARQLSGAFDFMDKEVARAGLAPREQLEAIPDFEWHVPMVSKMENMTAVANDATAYVPGARKAAMGRTEPPDDAYTTLRYYARRAATEIGSKDFGLALAAAERKFARTKDGEPDWEAPILSFNASQLAGIIRNGTRDQRAVALSIEQNHGMVVNTPVRKRDGSVGFERRYYWFNPRYQNGRATGDALNRALSSNYKLGSKFAQLTRSATSLYGQGLTRFSPLFQIVGSTRDMGERAMHMANREFVKEDGETLRGASVIGSFLGNIPRAGMMLYQAMRGKDPGSDGARLYEEFKSWGLRQKFVPDSKQDLPPLEQLKGNERVVSKLRDYGLDKQADWIKGKNFSAWRRVLIEAGAAGRAALRVLDGWNDWWQNLPAFAQYYALRKAGVDARRAAFAVREPLDFTKSGTLAHQLSVIAPFVRPTMQGAAAMARTFGLSGRNWREIAASGKAGWMAGLTAAGAFGVLYPLARAALGEDETGMPRMDKIPISRLTGFFPVGYDDEGRYVKLPMPFGPVRVAAALSLAMDRVARGKTDVSDAAFDVLWTAARDVVPGNNPAFNFLDKPTEFVAQWLCPAFLKPVIEVATNTNNFGGRIKADANPNAPASEQGFKTTPAIWHRIARQMRQTFGVDYAPETYERLAKGLSLGPLRLITSAIVSWGEKDEPHLGMHKPTALEEMNPILTALGGTLFFGKDRGGAAEYYYRMTDELMEKAKLAGVNVKREGKRGAEGEALVRGKLEGAGLAPDEIDDILLIMEARGKLLGYGRKFVKENADWRENDDNTGLKENFEKLAIQSDAVYMDVIQRSNYYKR